MQHAVCPSCRSALRLRLRQRISLLQTTRRQRSTVASSEPLESWYWDTVPPNPRQLAAASWFFYFHSPQKLWTASEWRNQNQNDDSGALIPEVAFLGRSNVGKSSLLNALLNAPDLNLVAPNPGKTKVMHAYGLFAGKKYRRPSFVDSKGVSNNLVTVLDAPGYGHASRTDWGNEIITYMRQRRNLRRIFVLIDAMHGPKSADLQMLSLLRAQAVSHQVIATKCDRLTPPSKRQELLDRSFEEIQKYIQPQEPQSAVAGLGEILAVGWLGDGRKNTSTKPNQMQGIDAVRWAVLRAVGLDDFALTRFNELDKAAQYDDSPLKPNAIYRAGDLFSAEQKYIPGALPQVMQDSTPETGLEIGPGTTPTPPQSVGQVPFRDPTAKPDTLTRQTVFTGMDALVAAVDKRKPKAKPMPMKKPESKRRAEQAPPPRMDQKHSKPAARLKPRSETFPKLGNLTTSMEALLAASKGVASKGPELEQMR